MNKWIFSLVALIFQPVMAQENSHKADQQKQPNIIICMTDDRGGAMLPTLGMRFFTHQLLMPWQRVACGSIGSARMPPVAVQLGRGL